MKCLMLVAGYATRLYPLTENFPKSLLKVNDKSILDHLIDNIEQSKFIDQYILVSNAKFYNIFKKWAATRKENIVVVDDGTYTNDTRLGAVKDIYFATEKLRLEDDIFVLAGDNLVDFSFKNFIDYFYQKKTTCVMRYVEGDVKKRSKSAVVLVDASDKVISFEEKPTMPKSKWCCPPFYIYTRNDSNKLRQAISEGCNTDAPGSFIAWLYKKSLVHAYEMPGRRYDIGDLSSYETVKRLFNKMKKCNL